MKDDGGGRALKTTETSLDIVEFVRDNDGVTLTEVAEAFDIAVSTAHGHLETLRRRHFLRKEDGAYDLGTAFINFGEHVRWSNPLFHISAEYVDELYQESGEGTGFFVEEDGLLLKIHNYIDTFEDSVFRAGKYSHMHATAGGKAILAELPDEEIEAIVNRRGLPRFTDNTITGFDELLDELEAVRETGIAYNDAESRDDIRGVGIAVDDPMSSFIGAITIGGPTYRVSDYKLEKYVTLLEETAESLVRDLHEVTEL